MNIQNIVKKEKNMATFEVKVPADVFDNAVNEVYKKNKSQLYVAGFRKGKAPRAVIEGMYGKDVFYPEAIETLAQEAFEAGRAECGFECVGAPSLLDQQINDDKELIYTFEVAVYPEVVLGQYKGLEVPQNHETFDESKVDEEMLNVQKRNARLIDVEREAKLGDHTTIDFAGFIDGKQFDGGTAENYDIELGSNTFVPGFEEQIVGMKAGDERDVVVTFPENYVAELAGKEATFKVTVKSVKEPELPELDDELAKDISDYETIAEYRDHVREDLEKQFNEEQESDYATRLMKAAVDNMTVEIPEPMVLAKLDQQINDDKELIYTFEVAVYPEVVLGQYKGLEVPQNHETFDESKVDEEMLNVQKRNARLIDVEREAKLGDHTTIDFAGFIDGKQFDGGTAENYDIELGSNTFVPGFEEQIVGMKAGDERDVVVTFPENYVAELAGKEATFKVTVKSVKEPELPELDDELAKDISDYETIAEYRDHVREDLEKQFNEEQESDYATRLMKAAVDNMTVEIPEPMVLAKLDEQLRNYISTMGVSPELTREQVLASMGLDEKTFQEIMRPQAMFEISTDLLLDAIVKAENIELDEGELDEMYQKMADEYKMEIDQIKQYVDEKIIVLDMKRRKAAQLIRDTAVDKEPEAKEEPAEAKKEAAE